MINYRMANWTEEDLKAHHDKLVGRAVKSAADLGKGLRDGDLRPLRMNKWEQAYAKHLENSRRARLIQWFAFEGIKLRLADSTFYTPDFAVMSGDGLAGDGRLVFHEVKGHWRDDALVKFKVAAEHFPFEFIAIRMRKASEGGGWEVVKRIHKTGTGER